jgi:alkylation response protein AidB-like acyl-CoA dehydrogenase
VDGLQTFREAVRSFLQSALTPGLKAAARQCVGIYCDRPEAQAWLAILDARGWAVPHWPVEHGGTGWSAEQHFIFQQELALAGAPPITPNATKMVGPVVIAFGSPEQKATLLPRIRSGEDWWAQGFSEPEAGSDLASLRCTAVRDGEHYVLNGSKLWTSHAQFSNKMFALVRTAAAARPQQGISFLLFDLAVPGVTIHPVISLSGDHEVNQVFFEAARVPVSSRLGEEGQGWAIAKHLLTHERSSAFSPGIRFHLEQLKARSGEPAVRSALAAAEIDLAALEAFELRELSAASGANAPGVSSSLIKVIGSELRQRICELDLALMGPMACARREGAGLPPPLADGALALAGYLNHRAASIYAGTNEIQRNIVARTLGMERA